MARSKMLIASVLAVASLNLFSSTFARADDDAGDSSMSQFQFSGLINEDNVYVRSGASENDYPVVKLSKGDTVVVVGAKGDWLKVLPPDGVWCVVGKVWVEKRGDGTVGRVRDGSTNANVRVGSNLNDMKAKVVTQVKPGDDVKIIGDLDEYFKIAPPAGAFVYVSKKFVDVVKRVEVVSNNGTMEVKQPDTGGTVPPNTPPVTPPPLVPQGTNPPTVTPPPTTGPSDIANNTQPPVAPPTTGPAVVENPTTAPAADTISAAEFRTIEDKFAVVSKSPLDEQPIDELIACYQKVLKDQTLPGSMLKIAAYRLNGLNMRRDALANLEASKKASAAIAARQVPLQAEANEISQRMQENQFKSFTAVGTLRTSAIYSNGKPLYRLTDPASGRTVVYIASTDPKLAEMEGSFIGVRGAVTDDTLRQIKFVTPTATEPVDPAEIGNGHVFGGMVPASITVAPKG